MRKLWIGLLGALALTFAGQVLGEETLPPIRVGNGQTLTQVTNGQTITVTTTATVAANVYLDVVTSTTVSGRAERSSTGTSAGDVTILWANRSISVQLHLSAAAPEVPFGMEGGEGDKRGSKEQVGGTP